jgi:hypothetical protein
MWQRYRDCFFSSVLQRTDAIGIYGFGGGVDADERLGA